MKDSNARSKDSGAANSTLSLEALRRDVAAGIASLERGEGRPVDEVFARLRAGLAGESDPPRRGEE